VSVASKVVIVDYGMGNLWSVQSAINYLGANTIITEDPIVVARADALVLPGVGSFYEAIRTLKLRGLSDALFEAVRIRQRKILGICLGMQLFAEKGTEDGDCDGLSFIRGTVERFSREELGPLKVPHIGFNHVHAGPQSRLFQGLVSPSDFYFVHSYRLLARGLTGELGLCNYGVEFLAAYEKGNIFATQFHPEKSQTNGLRLLKNFLAA